MIPYGYENFRLSNATCSIGHFKKFIEDATFRDRILRDAEYILDYGLKAYLQREYFSRSDGKAIILNEVDGEMDVVDGNSHLASILLVAPRITIGRLSGVVRFWREGHEFFGDCFLEDAFTVYIPYTVDTSILEENNVPVNITRDYFKEDHPLTKEIPANICFTDHRFFWFEQGRFFHEIIYYIDHFANK